MQWWFALTPCVGPSAIVSAVCVVYVTSPSIQTWNKFSFFKLAGNVSHPSIDPDSMRPLILMFQTINSRATFSAVVLYLHVFDPRGIGCICFDEFHERSIESDLSFALCAHLKRQRWHSTRRVGRHAVGHASQTESDLTDDPCKPTGDEARTNYLVIFGKKHQSQNVGAFE